MKIISSLIVTLIFITGCAVSQPQRAVFPNGTVFYPTWDGYSWCIPRPGGYAECYKNKDETEQPKAKISLNPYETYTEWTRQKTNMSSYDVNEICEKARVFFNAEKAECKNLLSIHLRNLGRGEEAFKLGLTSQEEYKKYLVNNGDIQKAYQLGFVNKSEYTQWHKNKLLDDGKIIEAYELGYIDKSTADLYMQKQRLEQQNEQARQQQAYQERQLKIQQEQAEAADDAARAARLKNVNDLYRNQQLQNINNYMRYGY